MTPDSSSHPSDDTLARMACNELSVADRAAVEAHLDDCDDCRAIWHAVERVQVEAGRFDPGAIPPPDHRFDARRWRPVIAAAAALIVAAGLFVLLSATDPEPLPVRSATTSTAPADLRPAEGERTAEPRFSWSAVESADGYVVELLDADGRPLWTSGRLDGLSAPWPASIGHRPGAYYWRVSAYFDDGGEPTASPLVRFERIAE